MSLTFGTYRLSPDVAKMMVLQAIEQGIENIDTAQLYLNEAEVGQALSQADHRPYLTTKIHRSDIKASRRDDKAILKSLNTSQGNLPYINCFLIHSPEVGYQSAWQQLLQLRQEGLVEEIGVSNFGISELESLLALGELPSINQIEVTPFHQCRELVKYCQTHHIKVTSHSSLTKAEKFDHPVLKALADERKVSPAQILLAWCLSKKIIPIFRTSSVEHLHQDQEIIELTESEVEKLDALEANYKTHPQYKLM